MTDANMLQNAAKAMRERPQAMHPAVAFKVADLLEREARRIGSHAITTRKVREDWYAYDCHTCGVGGSTSRAGLAKWQEAHSRVRPVVDDALLAIAHIYIATAAVELATEAAHRCAYHECGEIVGAGKVYCEDHR